MKNNRNPLYSAVHYALAAGVVSTLGASNVALAQDEDVAELERVEVTGSRIRRTDIVGPNPIQVIEREDLLDTGLQSVGEILENLPIAGAGLNTTVNNGGNGAILLDLRNLGSARILVLVNGRRWVTFPGSAAVDLQTIPTAIIERVEILKDGASAIYGSDAIAGVVNFITRKDFTGAQASVYYGEYDEGDGETTSANFSIGTAGDRASVFMNISYVQQEPVFAGDRPISAEPTFRVGGGSSGTPEGRFFFYAPDGSLRDVTFNEGATFPDGAPASAFRPFTGDDFYNFAPDNYLLTPSQRTNAYISGRYELTDNISFFTDFTYVKRESSQLLAANPLFLGFAAGSSVYIPADNPFNPFGFELDSGANGGPPDGNLVILGRRLLEAGNRIFRQESDTMQFTGGFEGNFELMSRYWNWETYYQFAKTREDDFNTGEQNVARIQIALDPDLCSVTPQCSILNLFGGAGGTVAQDVIDSGSGTISPQAVNFINAATNGIFTSERTLYAANLTGSLFDLPAGPVGVALGYEYRREKGSSIPDYLRLTGQLAGNASTPAIGSFDVNEAYVEFAIPILADLPLVETLEASIAARHSDYSNFGTTTNTKFGLRWQPFSDLLLRGTVGEAFRAPGVSELFQGQQDSFPTITDPCSDMRALQPDAPVGGRQTPQPQNIIDNCIAQGVPASGSYRQINRQIRITQGGNPNLGPELADTVTYGVVYSPSWLDGFDLTLDYFDYEIANAISSIGSQTILDGCAQGNLALCALIDRAATGAVIDLRNTATNIGGVETNGVDIGIHYAFPQTPVGFFEVNWDSTYVDEYLVINADASGGFVENEFTNVNSGDVAIPHWKSNVYLDWSFGDWSANYTLRYIGDMEENCPATIVGAGVCTDSAPTTPGVDPFNRLGSTLYQDAQVSYHFQPWDTRFSVGARNLWDEDPPVSYTAFANSFNPLQYDLPGRFWYASVTTNF